MGQFTLAESDGLEFEAIPENTIATAIVESCEVKETPFWVDDNDHTKGKKDQVSFRFRLTDGEYANRVLFGNTPTTFSTHPDCKLRVWVQEILAVETLPDNFSFDTDDLVNMTVKVVVGNRTRKAADGTDVVKDFVSDVIRVRSSLEENPF